MYAKWVLHASCFSVFYCHDLNSRDYLLEIYCIRGRSPGIDCFFKKVSLLSEMNLLLTNRFFF